MFLVFVFTLPVAFGCFSVCYADDGTELTDNITSLLDGLDLSALEEYLKNYGSDYAYSFGNSAREIVEYLINGNLNVNYAVYIRNILSAVFSGATGLLPAFSQIVAIIILCALCTDSENGLLSKTTARSIRLACTAAILLILASVLTGLVSATLSCIKNIKNQVEIITPILITLTVLTGGSEAGAIYRPCAMFLSEGAIYLVDGIIAPMTLTVIVLNFISAINPDISFTAVAGLLKSVMKWILGVTAAVFGIFLTVQSSASSLFNGIFFKVTKYLVGNSVPIVGNFLSAGVDMVVLSGTAVKSAVGLAGIVFLIGEIIQPIISLAAFSLMLKVTAAIAQPLGENAVYNTFANLAKDVEYLNAGVLTVSFLYVLTAMQIINSTYAFL